MAGYVANRFANEYPWLKENVNKNLTNKSTLTWTEQLSRGNLTTPSHVLFKCAQELEKLFAKFHGDNISKDQYIIKTVTQMLLEKETNLPLKVVECLVRTRTYIRINYLNKKILDIAAKNKIEKQKKLRKFVS